MLLYSYKVDQYSILSQIVIVEGSILFVGVKNFLLAYCWFLDLLDMLNLTASLSFLGGFVMAVVSYRKRWGQQPFTFLLLDYSQPWGHLMLNFPNDSLEQDGMYLDSWFWLAKKWPMNTWLKSSQKDSRTHEKAYTYLSDLRWSPIHSSDLPVLFIT